MFFGYKSKVLTMLVNVNNKTNIYNKKIPNSMNWGFPKNNTTQIMWFDPEP